MLMYSEFAPLTRFDVVMAFLRVQLWISIVTLLVEDMMALSYLWGRLSATNLYGLRIVGFDFVPVLLLVLFPSLLASNTLGRTARHPVASLADLRPLIGRCAGLFLFVQPFGQVVMFTVQSLYTFVTRPGSSVLGSLFGTPIPGSLIWMEIAHVVGPVFSFFVGFCLAFAPAIRDIFRAQ